MAKNRDPKVLIAEAQKIAQKRDLEWDTSLETILEYCAEDPQNRFSDEKAKEGDLSNLVPNYLSRLKGRYEIVEPRTINLTDPAVAVVLESLFRYPVDSRDEYRLAHRAAMKAENVVGELLERYIYSHLKKQGWVWCCGSVVKATDFLKREGTEWRPLQVKNKFNAENSSSRAIRDGTKIGKWHRLKRDGSSNWAGLPDNKGDALTEDGFLRYIRSFGSGGEAISVAESYCFAK